MFTFAIRRHIALAVAIFALTVAGFFLARASVADDARSETRHDAEVAAVQLSDSVERASGYVDSLRQFFGRRATVTQDGFSEFADAALRPVGLLDAAWSSPFALPGAPITSERSATGSPSRASTAAAPGTRAAGVLPGDADNRPQATSAGRARLGKRNGAAPAA